MSGCTCPAPWRRVFARWWPPAGRRQAEDPAYRTIEPEVWSQFDLTLYAGRARRTLQFVLVYNVDLFDAPRMAEWLDELAWLLAQASRTRACPVSSYSLVTRTAQAVLPDPGEPLDDTWVGAVHELFAAQARNAPDHVAVDRPAGDLVVRGARRAKQPAGTSPARRGRL